MHKLEESIDPIRDLSDKRIQKTVKLEEIIGKKIIGIKRGSDFFELISEDKSYFLYPVSDFSSCRITFIYNEEHIIDSIIDSFLITTIDGFWHKKDNKDIENNEYASNSILKIKTNKGFCDVGFMNLYDVSGECASKKILAMVFE